MCWSLYYALKQGTSNVTLERLTHGSIKDLWSIQSRYLQAMASQMLVGISKWEMLLLIEKFSSSSAIQGETWKTASPWDRNCATSWLCAETGIRRRQLNGAANGAATGLRTALVTLPLLDKLAVLGLVILMIHVSKGGKALLSLPLSHPPSLPPSFLKSFSLLQACSYTKWLAQWLQPTTQWLQPTYITPSDFHILHIVSPWLYAGEFLGFIGKISCHFPFPLVSANSSWT